MSRKVFLYFFTILLIFFLLTTCTKKPDDVIIANQPPETYIVNVPPDSAFIYHARLIFWYGTDADGIVARYDWAIDDTVYDQNIAGSGWHTLYMDSTLATQDTIAFEAPLPDTTYTHIFFVRAVDNRDLPDPTPSSRVFSTSNIPPNTRFVSVPTDSTQRFMLAGTTSTWRGINFEWTAIDSDKVFPPQFQYCWDDTTIDFDPVTHEGWSSPVSEESFYFTGENSPTTDGWHTVYVRAFDDAGAVDQSLSDTTLAILEADTTIDSTVTPWDTTITIIEMDTTVFNQWLTLYFVSPKIAENTSFRKILWINFTTNPIAKDYVEKPFWHSVLDDTLGLSVDSLDYATGLTDHILFGDYSTIIWSKGEASTGVKAFADNEGLIGDFIKVGGRMIFTGSSILLTGNYETNQTFGIQKPFIFSDFHIEQYTSLPAGTQSDTTILPSATDTAFYNYDINYPHLSLVLPNTPGSPAAQWYFLRNNFITEIMDLDLWGDYNGQMDILYTMNHYRDHASYERQPTAFRFTYEEALTPTLFYIGFPLPYCEKSRATQFVRLMMTELGE
jgi:hypothetical protein